MDAGSLPPQGHNRWVPKHKQQVVEAVLRGTISIRDVEQRYTLAVEEFVGWWKEYHENRMQAQ